MYPLITTNSISGSINDRMGNRLDDIHVCPRVFWSLISLWLQIETKFAGVVCTFFLVFYLAFLEPLWSIKPSKERTSANKFVQFLFSESCTYLSFFSLIVGIQLYSFPFSWALFLILQLALNCLVWTATCSGENKGCLEISIHQPLMSHSLVIFLCRSI